MNKFDQLGSHVDHTTVSKTHVTRYMYPWVANFNGKNRFSDGVKDNG
jgi:hypothetical protein